MPRKKAVETPEVAEKTVKKTSKATAAKTTTVRKPRKKNVVPNFVIQSTADQSVTYEAVLEKVNAAFDGEITSVDVYVKAEEGKAYYVINGDVTGDVDLF